MDPSQIQATPEVSQETVPQTEEKETPVVEDQPQSEEQPNESTETVETESESTEPEDKQNGEKTSEEDEGQPQHEQVRKPTRAEKRLHKLLKKGQNKGSFIDMVNSMPEPEPDENGFFTADQVKQMAAREVTKTLQMEREYQEYQAQTEEFVSDIEAVGDQILSDFKDNPELAEEVNQILTEQLQAANLRTDANGRQILVPVQRASQLYAKLKKALNLTEKQGTEKATATLAQQAAEGALTPGNQNQNNNESLQDLEKMLWSNPAKVRETLQKRLPRNND